MSTTKPKQTPALLKRPRWYVPPEEDTDTSYDPYMIDLLNQCRDVQARDREFEAGHSSR